MFKNFDKESFLDFILPFASNICFAYGYTMLLIYIIKTGI